MPSSATPRASKTTSDPLPLYANSGLDPDSCCLARVCARYELAVLFRDGCGVSKDTARMVSWLHKSAVQGHTEAQAMLARSFDEGIGVEENGDDAVEWYVCLYGCGREFSRMS